MLILSTLVEIIFKIQIYLNQCCVTVRPLPHTDMSVRLFQLGRWCLWSSGYGGPRGDIWPPELSQRLRIQGRSEREQTGETERHLEQIPVITDDLHSAGQCRSLCRSVRLSVGLGASPFQAAFTDLWGHTHCKTKCISTLIIIIIIFKSQFLESILLFFRCLKHETFNRNQKNANVMD